MYFAARNFSLMNNNLIFDIGMHVGQDTHHYLKKGFKVIAVEANPLLVAENEKKFAKDIEAGKLIIINKGISGQRGFMPFYINKRLSEWSSFDKELGMRNNTPHEIIEIECITTEDLIHRYGVPYYLKVDIEGYDFHVINGLPEGENRPLYVSCEASEVSLIDTLYQKGYRKFKLINQADSFNPVDLNKERKKYFPKYLHISNGIKLRLQKIFTFKHPYSSSGPFAEDTKGIWESYESVRDKWLQFSGAGHGKKMNNTSWFDVHATF